MSIFTKSLFTSRLKGDDEIFFVQQLSLMLRVNISIPKALDFLSKQYKDKGQRDIITDVRDSVTEGNSFEMSLKAHPKFFDAVMIDLVSLGELKGDLPSALESYRHLLKSSMTIRKKFKKAVAYPLVVVTAAVIMVIGASFFIFPQIESLFGEVQLELPLITRIVLAISGFMSAYGLYLFGGIFAVFLGVILFFRTKIGRPVLHLLLLHLPLSGRVVRERNLSQIMSYLSVLIKSGMSIIQVLEAVARMTTHTQYRESLLYAKSSIGKGNRLSNILRGYPALYPSIPVELVAVGEETGTFEEVTAEISSYYEERLFNMLDSLPAIIEPALIFTIGLLVAFIALAVLLPMYSLANSI